MRYTSVLPSIDRLRDLLAYDPETGLITWRVTRGRGIRPGAVAGTDDGKGYRQICVDYHHMRLHRVAWAMHHGAWPDGLEVDHRNGVKTDNRITNLRLATHKQNHENRRHDSRNRVGFRGVSWDTARSKWVARIEHHGAVLRNRYETLIDAVAARLRAERSLFTHHREQ